MATAEERLAAVEANVTDLRGTLDKYAVDIETTRLRSMELITEKTSEIEKSSELAHAKVHELYEIANRAISGDGQYGQPYSPKSLLPAKAMVPAKLAKLEEWKRWKVDLEDYAEDSLLHLKDALHVVKAEEGDYGEAWFESRRAPPKMASMRKEVWRMLRTYTEPGSDCRKVVEGASQDDGWTAWRRLQENYEPSLMVREGQVLAELAIMANKVAKKPSETKKFLLDLEDKIRRVNEIVGRNPDDMRCKSIVLGFMDAGKTDIAESMSVKASRSMN